MGKKKGKKCSLKATISDSASAFVIEDKIFITLKAARPYLQHDRGGGGN